MFASAAFLALAVSIAQAAVSPLTPATIQEGQQLQVQWSADTTGTWTNVSIALMSGSNWEMNLVAPITDGVDGTQSPGLYEWTVPDVTPNSGIYFIQFTNNGADPTWTTRFAIASSSGETTEPTETVQPDGQDIAWGIGALAGSSPLPVSSAPISGSAVGSAMSSASSVAEESSMPSASASARSSSMPDEDEEPTSTTAQASTRSQVAARESVTSGSARPTVNADTDSAAGQLQVAGVGLAVALAVGMLAV